MLATMIGSRISSMSGGGGSFAGLSTYSTVPSRLQHLVHHGRRTGHQRQLVLALQALLHDVHVQQSEEAAAEAEAECAGDFRLVVQRGVVEAQLGERIAELLEVIRVHRKQPREDARLDLLEPRQRRRGRAVFQGDRVPDRCAVDLLDAGHHEADVAGGELALDHRLGREAPEAIDDVAAAGGHHADLVAAAQRAVDHAHQRHDPDVVVEPGIDDQRLQRRLARRRAARGCAG